MSLSLALVVYNNEELDQNVRDKILFFVAFLATLTILVNGTTTGYLVRKLGMTN